MKVYIVYGVSGVGKSTIAEGLADRLSIPYYDADDYHPQSNLDKMMSGQPLNDNDRLPWLRNLANEISVWSQSTGAVLACSALKEKYRALLSQNHHEVRWVLLHGSRDLIADRLKARKGHFFNGQLLDSQFATLEKPDYGCQVDVVHSPEEILDIVLKHNFDE